MSTLQGQTSMETIQMGDSLLGNRIAPRSPQRSGNLDDSSLTKKPLKKSVSNSSITSLSSNISLTFQDNGTKLNEISDRTSGRGTIERDVETSFRERLPSFSIRQALIASKLQTHFAVYKFLPRHRDELAMNVGDTIHVAKVHGDLWYEGTNLKTGDHGIFPGRYVSDILSHTGSSFAFSENGVQFFLRFLGSVEVSEFKGNAVLCQAIAKILNVRKNCRSSEIPPCSLEVDYRGIRLINHAQELNERRQAKSLVGRLFNNEQKVSKAKYFFKLKDVTFCGCYPNSPRYFGFVTKHPSDHRFACHTFMSEYSTEPVAKAIGQAFQRFYVDHVERSSLG